MSDDPVDFPAAHSMDTTWFAIDRDGHVAVFDTGESGCVPRDAYLGEDHGEVTDLVRELAPTGAVHDLAGWRAAGYAEHVDLARMATIDQLLVFVPDVAPVRDLLARLGAQEVAATTGPALSLRSPDKAALDELHARGACLGCFLTYDERGELAAHGVYRYGQTCDNWIAGPYVREAIPAVPIQRDALPALTRVAEYPGRFAETPELQPAELWPCESWGPVWLAGDRKTVRPFEGRESEYAEAVADLRGVDPALVFVDAPPALPAEPAPDPAPRRPWWKFW